MSEQVERGIAIEDGFVPFTEEQAVDLARLVQHPGWKPFKTLLKGIEESVVVGLRDETLSLDRMRFLQGKSACARMVADILEGDVTEWYNDGQSEPDEGAEEDESPE